MSESPKVLICLTAKNDAKYLPSFLEQIKNLDYPKEKLRMIWMYGKSVDFTLDIILKFHKENPVYKYEVYEEAVFENKTNSSLWIADLLNTFKNLIKDEEYVLLPDTDIVEIPSNTLKELINTKKEIIAPYIYIKDKKPYQFFDTYVFRVNKHKFENVTIDNVKYNAWKVPFKDSKVPVELDSVGSFILMTSKVFKEVYWTNPIPHFQFCRSARKQGFKVWAAPYLEIKHANVESDEAPHLSVETLVMMGRLSPDVLSKI